MRSVARHMPHRQTTKYADLSGLGSSRGQVMYPFAYAIQDRFFCSRKTRAAGPKICIITICRVKP